eukprot:3322012-Prymnesium_polylepis.1
MQPELSNQATHPQETPTQENDDVIGKRKSVWWADEKSWYSGVVTHARANNDKTTQFHILYDDGDSDWETEVRDEEDILPLLCNRNPHCCKLSKHLGRCRGVTARSAINKKSNDGAPTCSGRAKGKRECKPIKKLGHKDGWIGVVSRRWSSSA